MLAEVSIPLALGVGFVVAAALLWMVVFSRRARGRRRYRGGHGRVRDQRHGPAVQLNLKVKDNDKR